MGECLQCCTPPSLSLALAHSLSSTPIRSLICSSPSATLRSLSAFLLLAFSYFSPLPSSFLISLHYFPFIFTHFYSLTSSFLVFSASVSPFSPLVFFLLPRAQGQILPLLLHLLFHMQCCEATGNQQGSHWSEELP